MKLHWVDGQGPATTQELAEAIRQEGRLGRGLLYNPTTKLRCAWGGAEDAGVSWKSERHLTPEDVSLLFRSHFTPWANDHFAGTPEELCEHMAQIVDRIP